jgi:hypothetical protein
VPRCGDRVPGWDGFDVSIMSIETPADFYIATTREGKVTKSFHRVWDTSLFMSAQHADAEKATLKNGKPDTSAKVVQITEAQFKGLK